MTYNGPPPAIAGRQVRDIRTAEQIVAVARKIEAYPIRDRLGLLTQCKQQADILRVSKKITPEEMGKINQLVLGPLAREQMRRKEACRRPSKSSQTKSATRKSTETGLQTGVHPPSTEKATLAAAGTVSSTSKPVGLTFTR